VIEPRTLGCHHVGLAVSRLEDTAAFFTQVLGWREVGRRPAYPAVFVSDGTVMVTLWALGEGAAPFDRRTNAGLHHLALRVPSEAALEDVHAALRSAPGVRIEFAPEPLGDGPARHMMCYEPSGIRIEFIWSGGPG
jgi:catechol 2,3-dioxygenase-like lactoylglutathione lyase family enzyme